MHFCSCNGNWEVKETIDRQLAYSDATTPPRERRKQRVGLSSHPYRYLNIRTYVMDWGEFGQEGREYSEIITICSTTYVLCLG